MGVCFVKKDKPTKIGSKNQLNFNFELIANMKQSKDIVDKYEDWWSTYGVPDDGYAKYERDKVYIKQ